MFYKVYPVQFKWSYKSDIAMAYGLPPEEYTIKIQVFIFRRPCFLDGANLLCKFRTLEKKALFL
jgi:hypothetical protein